MRALSLAVAVCCALLSGCHAVVAVASVTDFGAVAGVASNTAAQANGIAFQLAFQNVSRLPAPRVVLVPPGDFYAFPAMVSNITNVTVLVQGRWIAHDNVTAWPRDGRGHCLDFLVFIGCHNLHLTGPGSIVGQGYLWWWLTILNVLKDQRPRMVVVQLTQNIVVNQLRFYDSPSFHLLLEDVLNVTVFDIVIQVDVEAQKGLLQSHGFLTNASHPLGAGIPTFPLNTDGIDPSGKDIHIYNVTIQNFDDAVAVKPSRGSNFYSNCSQNILVENSHVSFGVGMTIGSVPPHPEVNCVRDVTFRNISFTNPIKAVYVKSNPGTEGAGLIQNITYLNLTMTNPLWWNIYVGPQQQRQPDGGGPGCMIYPLNPDCPTNPLVVMSDLTFRNIHSTGILRCNASRPCENIVFDNVHVEGTDFPTQGYICENMRGSVTNSSPAPACF